MSVSCGCFQTEVSATGRSFIQRRPTDCVCVCVCVCDLVTSRLRWPMAHAGLLHRRGGGEEVEFYLSTPCRYTGKAAVYLELHEFLTSKLDAGAWSASRPGRFTPRKNLAPIR
jgi:hypothetical protein